MLSLDGATGLVNQSRASTEAFEAMRLRLARLLDAAARSMPACPIVVRLPDASPAAIAAGRAEPTPADGCALGGTAYIVAGPDGDEWELFLKLRCPNEPTWVASGPIRFRENARDGQSAVVVPAAWRVGGSR